MPLRAGRVALLQASVAAHACCMACAKYIAILPSLATLRNPATRGALERSVLTRPLVVTAGHNKQSRDKRNRCGRAERLWQCVPRPIQRSSKKCHPFLLAHSQRRLQSGHDRPSQGTGFTRFSAASAWHWCACERACKRFAHLSVHGASNNCAPGHIYG